MKQLTWLRNVHSRDQCLRMEQSMPVLNATEEEHVGEEEVLTR